MSKTCTKDAQERAADAGKKPILIRLSPEAAAALERLAASREVDRTNTTKSAVEAILRIADADPDLAVRLLDGAPLDEASISAHAPTAPPPRLAVEPGLDAARALLAKTIAIMSPLRDDLRVALERPSMALIHGELATIRIRLDRSMSDLLDYARQLASRVCAETVVHEIEADPDEDDLSDEDEGAK